jgi:methionyl-tRNA formyltransferase
MNDSRFVFAGNRFFVLRRMLELKLSVVKVFAEQNSFLARELQQRNLPFEYLSNKRELVNALKALDFDIFVSNGCSIILPISELSQGNQKRFINIHPSLLPDLRGRDPVPGAILSGLPSGATCHLMDDRIDTGDIIAQVPIEMTDDLECGLLYQLSFKAEQEAFERALESGFTPAAPQESKGEGSHYTRKDADLKIDFRDDAAAMCRRIRAFNSRSQGAFFVYRGRKFVVRDCELIENPFLLSRFPGTKENEVVLSYEGKLIIRKGSGLLKLKQISEGEPGSISVGEVLGE